MASRLLVVALLAGSLIATAAGARAGTGPAIKLVIWYDRSRPFETFRHRAYDVGKGEYTRAVDDWMALMERSYPGYTVTIHDLPAAQGDPAGRIAAAVEEEKLALARFILEKYSLGPSRRSVTYDSGYGGLSRSPQTTVPVRNASPFKHGIPSSLYPLGAAHTVPSPSYPFPHPIPYPRPHP